MMSLVTVQDLTKAYNNTNVVENLSFSLQEGKCVALLGPNGAGKTTTLKMLAGFIQPTSGTITFDVQSLSDDFEITLDIYHNSPFFIVG